MSVNTDENHDEAIVLDGEPTPTPAAEPGTPEMGVLNAAADAIEQIDHAIEQLRSFQNRLKTEANILAGRMGEYTGAAKQISETFAAIVEENGKLMKPGDRKW